MKVGCSLRFSTETWRPTTARKTCLSSLSTYQKKKENEEAIVYKNRKDFRRVRLGIFLYSWTRFLRLRDRSSFSPQKLEGTC